jgi:ABC-2 type transport system ATP-binding protein
VNVLVELEIRELSKKYGRVQALDRVSLSIEKGGVYGLLGPNGSGKTTTLGIILGIIQPDSGDFTWFDGKYGDDYRLKIGAILETPNFYPYMNADENLDIIRHIKKSSETSFDELLDLVNLSQRRKSAFSTFSLGMKQRLAIAATLVGDPDVLIFDEPTNGLDPQGIVEVREILQRVAQSGKTVIMASHILDEVEKICSHVAILKNGQLLAQGPIGQIIHNNTIVEISSENTDLLWNCLSQRTDILSLKKQKNFLEITLPEDVSITEISRYLSQNGIFLTHLVVRKTKLEEEFLAITKN